MEATEANGTLSRKLKPFVSRTSSNASMTKPKTKQWKTPKQLCLASLLFDSTIEPIVRRLLLLSEISNTPAPAEEIKSWGSELEQLRQKKELVTELRSTLKHALESVDVISGYDDGVGGAARDGAEGGSNNSELDDEECESLVAGIRMASISIEEEDSSHKILAYQEKVIRQINGISVPLMKILRNDPNNSTRASERFGSESGQDSGQRMYFILRSASYACMEEAAVTLSLLWSCRQRICDDEEVSKAGKINESSFGNGRESGVSSFVLPCLISCAMALSSLEISCEGDNTRDHKGQGVIDKKNHVGEGECNDDPMNRSGVFATEDRGLDRGDNCAVAILSCVQSFFQESVGHSEVSDFLTERSTAEEVNGGCESTNNDGGGTREKSTALSRLARDIGDAMGGALLARIVQSCLDLLGGDNDNNQSGKDDDDGRVFVRKENNALKLKALETIKFLIEGIPSKEVWQSMLPGCFASLYKSTLSNLRYSSAASAHKVASESLVLIALLLKQTLSSQPSDLTISETDGDGDDSIVSALMAIAKQSKEKVTCDNDVNTQCSPSSEENDNGFRNEVNARLPSPLLVILRLVALNRSRFVQRSAIILCRTLLMDVKSTWNASNAEALGRSAIEYCLMMTNCDDKELSVGAIAVLRQYKSHLGVTSWRRQLSEQIVPTILELVEMLPVLAKSGRDVEVLNHLMLIDGYLLLSFKGMKNEFDFHECVREKRKSDIQAALSCHESVEALKKTFSALFEPDIDSIPYSPSSPIDGSLQSNQIISSCRSFSRHRFLHLRDETISEAKRTIFLFARAVGTKKCAFIIDACFAEIFESCSANHHETEGGLHSTLKWTGLCIFATEVLAGMSRWDDNKKFFRLSKSTQNILSSLASSVLPIVVSDSLWSLRTSSDSTSIGYLKQQLRSEGKIESGSISFDVMNSNAILICSLMAFICRLSNILREDFCLQLPIILLPLLERASNVGNHPYVTKSSLSSLIEVSLSVGLLDSNTLLFKNFDYLIDLISLQLRKHARERTNIPASLLGVIDVVLSSVLSYRGARGNCDNSLSTVDSSHVSVVENMLHCLLESLDRRENSHYFESSNATRVLSTICLFMDSSVDAQIGPIKLETLEIQDCREEWLKRLDFDLSMNSAEIMEEIELDGEHSFESSADAPVDTINEGAPDVIENDEDEEQKSVCPKEISTINVVLSRCCYLISSSDLQVAISCCETISKGFASLGKIGAFQKKVHGESAPNPLLPAISECWPPILDRLRSTSSNLLLCHKLSRSDLSIRQSMASECDHQTPRSNSVTFLAKLLDIISALCRFSDGFFADRFKSDVYPILAQNLGALPEYSKGHLSLTNGSTNADSSISKHSLLLPILRCIESAFDSGCGRSLCELIPSAGTMLLPLLSLEGPAGDAVLDTLKTLLKIDCDSLWRGIYKLSGKPFPSNPVEKPMPTVRADGLIIGKNNHWSSSTLRVQQKSLKLLEFIETLPEQEIY